MLCPSLTSADSAQSAAKSTNQLGLDLYKALAHEKGNLCLSPYSIESALAMTFAGAAGDTRTEMARVLHFDPADDNGVADSFAALQKSLVQMSAPQKGAKSDQITLAIANRLFAQKDYPFRPSFLALVKQKYDAPLQPLDFKKNSAGATKEINDWVADQTRKRIVDLIPPNGLDETTRMVLANALYLKAPWAEPFEKSATRPEPFHANGGTPVDVPMMHETSHGFGYGEKPDFTMVSLPYKGNDLRFTVLLPKEVNGLASLESKLSAALLDECAHLSNAYVALSFPKFKMEPPTIALQSELKALGMKTAFDEPAGSANFDRLAPRRPDDYLYISKVFHKTFIAVDEDGTEAAAATAVAMSMATSAMNPEQPIAVKVDRPFIYLIQQASTGVCLFIGRVTDPR